MFFFLSKILAVFFKPLTWVIILLLLSFIIKRPKLQKRLRISSLVLLLFFSNLFIVHEFMRAWEMDAVKSSELEENYDVAIVLGGGMAVYDFENERPIFRGNTDRILQAIHLYNEKRVDYILISGGPGLLVQREIIEAKILYNYLHHSLGIPDTALLIDSISDNTYENAVYSKELLENIEGDNYLLISSASHIRRANACFEKQGISAKLFPVDHNSGPRRWDVFMLLFPSYEAFKLWDELFHEWFGLLVYKIKGYI